MEFRISRPMQGILPTTIYKDREMYVMLSKKHGSYDYRGKDLGLIDESCWQSSEPIDAETVARILIQEGLF